MSWSTEESGRSLQCSEAGKGWPGGVQQQERIALYQRLFQIDIDLKSIHIKRWKLFK